MNPLLFPNFCWQGQDFFLGGSFSNAGFTVKHISYFRGILSDLEHFNDLGKVVIHKQLQLLQFNVSIRKYISHLFF